LNSCAISASEVLNIIGAPIPCAGARDVQEERVESQPAGRRQALKIASPSIKTSLRPTRSASDPAANTKPARVSAVGVDHPLEVAEVGAEVALD
jgi:hypothetical protein